MGSNHHMVICILVISDIFRFFSVAQVPLTLSIVFSASNIAASLLGGTLVPLFLVRCVQDLSGIVERANMVMKDLDGMEMKDLEDIKDLPAQAQILVEDVQNLAQDVQKLQDMADEAKKVL